MFNLLTIVQQHRTLTVNASRRTTWRYVVSHVPGRYSSTGARLQLDLVLCIMRWWLNRGKGNQGSDYYCTERLKHRFLKPRSRRLVHVKETTATDWNGRGHKQTRKQTNWHEQAASQTAWRHFVPALYSELGTWTRTERSRKTNCSLSLVSLVRTNSSGISRSLPEKSECVLTCRGTSPWFWRKVIRPTTHK